MSLKKREPKSVRSTDPFFNDPFFHRRFSDFFGPGRSLLSEMVTEGAAPRVDVIDKKDAYEVVADLPGVKKDNIELSLDQGILTIKATAESESKEESEGKLIRHERYTGQFVRSLDLGTGVTEQGISAEYDNGVLTITIPKTREQVPEPIKIEVH